MGKHEDRGKGTTKTDTFTFNRALWLFSLRLLQEVLSKMDSVVKEIDDLMTSQLNPELQDWKRRQQIAGIGGPMLTGLEQLQSW